MKKKYLRPITMTVRVAPASLICNSNDISTLAGEKTDLGIGFGGVDTEGGIEANSRGSSIWDDDE